jgi:hypothetical protein
MTSRLPGSSATNIAKDSDHVDMQIAVINASVCYQVNRDNPPEKKYEIGLGYLNGNMPREAEEFQEAFGAGYKSAGVALDVVRRVFNCLAHQEESEDTDREEFEDVLRSYALPWEAQCYEIRRHPAALALATSH